MKTLKIIGTMMIAFLLTNCNSMEDNYKDYLSNVQTYSPRVINLAVVSGLKEATLTWTNPKGNIAVKNVITLQDSTIVLDGLVETYKLTNLEIKGYQVSVYTVDKFNNYSVPATLSIFPNGE
ncbi:MAG: DUF4998 domain-containing protein [Bacteroidota bacterium]|nr:DUF4998 domain-containing protein [Bacteroidota bacterium]